MSVMKSFLHLEKKMNGIANKFIIAGLLDIDSQSFGLVSAVSMQQPIPLYQQPVRLPPCFKCKSYINGKLVQPPAQAGFLPPKKIQCPSCQKKEQQMVNALNNQTQPQLVIQMQNPTNPTNPQPQPAIQKQNHTIPQATNPPATMPQPQTGIQKQKQKPVIQKQQPAIQRSHRGNSTYDRRSDDFGILLCLAIISVVGFLLFIQDKPQDDYSEDSGSHSSSSRGGSGSDSHYEEEDESEEDYSEDYSEDSKDSE